MQAEWCDKFLSFSWHIAKALPCRQLSGPSAKMYLFEIFTGRGNRSRDGNLTNQMPCLLLFFPLKVGIRFRDWIALSLVTADTSWVGLRRARATGCDPEMRTPVRGSHTYINQCPWFSYVNRHFTTNDTIVEIYHQYYKACGAGIREQMKAKIATKLSDRMGKYIGQWTLVNWHL
jgi:hypothetical protein